VGPGVTEALRGIAALGLPLGIVSNSTGEVEETLRLRGVCYAGAYAAVSDHVAAGGSGTEVGVVIDSAVVGVSKPDPAIFAVALEALGIPDAERSTVVHVGDSLRYDVTGAIAAGVRPVHLGSARLLPSSGRPRATSAASTRSSRWRGGVTQDELAPGLTGPARRPQSARASRARQRSARATSSRPSTSSRRSAAGAGSGAM